MYPTTGYTPEMDERNRLRNEIRACIANYHHQQEVLVSENRSAYDCLYWHNRAVNAIRKYREYRDNVMRLRLADLLAALEENPPMEQALEIIDEVAEITNHFQRDGEAMSDYGDARREAKYGTQL